MNKVSVNLRQNAFGFSFAKAFYEPLIGLMIVLTLVTAIYSIAKRDDIGSGGATSFGQRNPMVSRSSMEETIQRAFAHGTTVLKVIQAILPISPCEVVWQAKFASASPVMVDFNLRPVQLAVDMVVILHMFLVGLTPVLKFYQNLLVMSAPISRRAPSGAFGMKSVKSLRLSFCFFWMLVYPIQFPGIVAGFAMGMKPIRSVTLTVKIFGRGRLEYLTCATLLHTFGVVSGLKAYKVSFARFARFCISAPTYLATGIQSITVLPTAIEMLAGRRFPHMAIRTLLKRNVVGHDRFSLAGFASEGCGQAAKLAVRTGNYSVLVHPSDYTLQVAA